MPNPSPAILPGIDHIVVVMLENRSFDSTLGWLYDGDHPRQWIPPGGPFQFRGLTDALLPQLANPLTIGGGPTRYYPPVKGATPTVEDGASYLNSPPYDPHEELQYVTDQIYGPLKWTTEPPINPPAGARPDMKGFLQDYVSALPAAKRTDLPSILRILETYTPAQMPVLNGLARAFACSDMWFSSAPTQTNPNRAFLACGTSLGQINNQGSWAYGDFDAPTIWNRLKTLGVSWRIFWEEVFVPVKDDDNRGWTRKAFPQLRQISTDADFPNMAEFHRRARNGNLPAFSFIEPSWTLEAPEIGQTNGIQGDDYHPPGDVRPGEDLLAQIYTSLFANRPAFERTLLVITFDEHGGTFDHWAPPPAVAPDGDNQQGFDFKRYGVRVPAIFVSPWIESGTVIRASSQSGPPPFDHGSVAATVLKWKGLQPAQYGLRNRVQQAPTFEAVLNRTSARPPEDLVLGALRAPSAQSNVRLGDRFALRYVSPGPYKAAWLSAATWSISGQAYYPTLTNDPNQAAILQFTLGDVAVPQQDVTHGSFVYVRSGETAVKPAPYWKVSTTAVYERTDVYYATDTSPTVPGSGLYWMLKLTDPALAVVGQRVRYGDALTLQNRCIPSTGDWLPGKLIPSPSKFDSTVYVALTDDPDYANGSVGQWILVPVQGDRVDPGEAGASGRA